jgi:hypothetical protein
MADKDEPITLLMKQGKGEKVKAEGRKGLTTTPLSGDFWRGVFTPSHPNVKFAKERRHLPTKDLELLNKLDVGKDGDYSKLTYEDMQSLSDETVDYLLTEKDYQKKIAKDPNFFSNFLNNLGEGFGERVTEGSDMISKAGTEEGLAGSLESWMSGRPAVPAGQDPVKSFSFMDSIVDLEKQALERALGTATIMDAPMGALSKALVPDKFGEGGRLAFELGSPFALFGVGKMLAKAKKFDDLLNPTEAEFKAANRMTETGKINEHQIVEILEQNRIDDARKAADDLDQPYAHEIKPKAKDDIMKDDADVMDIARYTAAARDILAQGKGSPFAEAMGFADDLTGKTKRVAESGAQTGQSAYKKWPKDTSKYGASKFFQDVAALRNADLVSGVATAMRNAETVVGFFGIHAADEAMQGIIKAITKRGAVDEKELGASLSFMNDILRTKSLRLAKDNKIDEIFRAYSDELAEMGLYSKRVFETGAVTKSVQTAAHLVSSLNNLQEYYFRRIAFEAMMRQKARARGVDFNSMKMNDIPLDEIKESTDYALRMTFAKDPQGAMADMLKELSSGKNSGFFKLFVMPFPRFVFGNAIPFMYEFSPLGMLSALSPKTMKKLAKGDPKDFAKYASRAMIGSTMTHAGMNIRGSSMGEVQNADGTTTRLKWYQTNFGGELGIVDMRPFAPLIGPYLFAAEAVLHPENLGMSDVPELFLGLNRLGATGLTLLDSMIAAQYDESGDMEEILIGKALGSFIAPMLVPKIVESVVNISVGLGALSPEAATFRSDAIDVIKGPGGSIENITNQMFATLQRNIPYWREKMPRAFDPIDPDRGIPRKVLGKSELLYKEWLGIKVDRVHPVTAQMQKLGFTKGFGASRTGFKPFDNQVNAEIAIKVNAKGELADQIKGPDFRKMKFYEKKKHIREYFSKKNGAIWDSAIKVYGRLIKDGFHHGDLPSRKIFMQSLFRMAFSGDTDLRQTILDAQGMNLKERPEHTVKNWLELIQ